MGDRRFAPSAGTSHSEDTWTLNRGWRTSSRPRAGSNNGSEVEVLGSWISSSGRDRRGRPLRRCAQRFVEWTVRCRFRCASGAATWNATVQKFTYTTVSVAYTEGSTDACSGQKLKVNVYATSGGAELSTGTAVTITDGSDGAAGTAFTLSTAVDAGLATADYKYGVIFQTA